MVEIALVSSERLTRLINEILDIERIESGVLPWSWATHPARGLIDCGRRPGPGDRRGRRRTGSRGRAEGEVYADADRVVQTLLNLLGNAIKFSRSGNWS